MTQEASTNQQYINLSMFRVSVPRRARVGGVFGTLRHPHLIRPYLAYYDHVASHDGGPWCSPIPWWCD